MLKYGYGGIGGRIWFWPYEYKTELKMLPPSSIGEVSATGTRDMEIPKPGEFGAFNLSVQMIRFSLVDGKV